MEENTGKKKKKSRYAGLPWYKKILKFLKSKLFGVIVSGVQFVINMIFLSQLLYLNVLPVKFFVPLAFITLFLVGYTFLTVQSRKFITFGKVLAVLLTVIYCFGIYYVGSINGMFDSISGHDEKTDVVNVYVLKDDPAQIITDAKDYSFGILEVLGREQTDKAILNIEKELGNSLNTVAYESWMDMIDDFYAGKIGAIIINEGYVGMMEDVEGYETFEEDIRLLTGYTVVTKIDAATTVDVSQETFVLYISGNDNFGSVNINGRSDVNILAIVNPSTRQILLLNTPRDYYVTMSNSGQLDKLTHAGVYGIDVSMKTLGNLYGIDVNYFFKVNFTGFQKVIDALGGVDITSEYEFTTYHGGYYIKKGVNHLSGIQALCYCRERFSLPTGDNQRGKNQMQLIQAVIKSMASSNILNDFSSLMDGLSDSFATSMSSTQISALVRKQLNEGGSWNVVTYAVTGYDGNDYCYSLGASNYVMYQNATSIAAAKTLIQQVMDGKTIDLSAVE